MQSVNEEIFPAGVNAREAAVVRVSALGWGIMKTVDTAVRNPVWLDVSGPVSQRLEELVKESCRERA